MRRSRLFFGTALMALILGQGCAASNSDAKASVPKKCSEVIHEYVKRTRGWDKSSYVIDEEGFGGPGLGFSVWLLEEDIKILPPGGGRSFHVELDQACTRVTEELAYQ